jgi:hypothetical protein
VELFNLKSDIAEANDLSKNELGKLKEMQSVFAAWNKENIPPLWRRSDGGSGD